MDVIYQEYTMYIPGISMGICDIPVIYQAYTVYIPGIYNVYILHIHSILLFSTPPGGWCCGRGQGPIPPEPPAITSPGRVMIFILLHSWPHLGFLLLVMWMHRARLELKIAGKCSAWQARHTNRSSSTSIIPLSEYVPMRRATKATAKRIGGWNREWTVIPGIYQVYAGIYLVYTKYRNVDKRLDPTATLAHLPFIEARPYVSGYPLHLPVSPPFFAEMYTL